jgi:hypothetical protein
MNHADSGGTYDIDLAPALPAAIAALSDHLAHDHSSTTGTAGRPRRLAARKASGFYNDDNPAYMAGIPVLCHKRSYHPTPVAIQGATKLRDGHPNPNPVPDDPQRGTLAVGTSTLPAAGRGLFTLRDFAPGDVICEYTGDIVPTEVVKDPNFHTTVAFELNGMNNITLIPTTIGNEFSCLAAYINDPLDISFDNCESFQQGNRIYIRATQYIYMHQELFMMYGFHYWDDEVAYATLYHRILCRYTGPQPLLPEHPEPRSHEDSDPFQSVPPIAAAGRSSTKIGIG